MGSNLYATFVAADLPAPQLMMGTPVEGGPQALFYDYLAGLLRSLLPQIENLGLATAAEIDVDTVAERLRKEADERTACLMGPPLVGAWSHTPT